MRYLYIMMGLLASLAGSAQQWEWAKTAGGAAPVSGAYIYSIAPDGFGHVYAVGTFSFANISFGTITLPNPTALGIHSVLVIKYDTAGNVIWARTAPVSNWAESYPVAAATDAGGNVYVTGLYEADTITFGATKLAGNGNTCTFITKYDSSGNVLWARSCISSGSYTTPGAIATGPSGNVYITGAFAGSYMLLGADTLRSIGGAGYESLFLIKLDPAGNTTWMKAAGSLAGNIEPTGLTADNNERIYMAASNTDTEATFGTAVYHTGSILLAAYDSSGNTQWVTGAGYNTGITGRVAADASGHVYWAGSFPDTAITFGAFTLTNTTGGDIGFTVKCSSAGSVLAACSTGNNTNNGCEVRSVATDFAGNVYITGFFVGPSITFDTDVLAQRGQENIFVARYDTALMPQWGIKAGGTGADDAFAICTDRAGNLYAAGYISSPQAYFGNGSIMDSVSPYENLFIAKVLNTPVVIDTPSSPPPPAATIITLYPNPATGSCTIRCTTPFAAGATARLYDVAGQRIGTYSLSGYSTVIDLTGLAAAMYFCRIDDGNSNVVVKKLLVE